MANRVNDHFISLGKYLQNSLDVIIMSLIGFEEVFAMTPLFIEFTVRSLSNKIPAVSVFPEAKTNTLYGYVFMWIKFGISWARIYARCVL